MNDDIHARLATEQFRQRRESKQDGQAKARADEIVDHLSHAEDLLSDAASTLRKLSAHHLNANQIKNAELAIQHIDAAIDLFQIASTCQNPDWNVL